jgi:FAD-dependent sensor of blue light
MPFRLIYSSEAAAGLAAVELEEMLAESRIRNLAHGITGVLLFVEGAFLQILEGEKNDVVDLMERIQRDPRHHDIKVFYEEEVDERAFASWSMAYLTPSAEDVSKWAELEGATTIGDVLASVERNPGRLPKMVVNILKTLAAP